MMIMTTTTRIPLFVTLPNDRLHLLWVEVEVTIHDIRLKRPALAMPSKWVRVPRLPWEFSEHDTPAKLLKLGGYGLSMKVPLIYEGLHEIIDQEVPANSNPLNTMDEDLLDESNDNDYEDFNTLILDEEEMADTFVSFDHIQDLEMSTKSSKICRFSFELITIHLIDNEGFDFCGITIIFLPWSLQKTIGIHMLIHIPTLVKNTLISGVHGPIQVTDKGPFWDHLIQVNSIINLPWMLVGDFNELELLSEKKQGNPHYYEELNDL
ncbi:hypothetical protein Cgig2_016942 [Carnegiea gigantea]|uniref:Uncharacterized protein n=1 Tax=Carnegiea gigantea TaxID=171969 RepID=A0A9Q1JQ86_9CARY|nr:hypothetical protein Cgig2_016942 [Carnegiea gigantea]